MLPIALNLAKRTFRFNSLFLQFGRLVEKELFSINLSLPSFGLLLSIRNRQKFGGKAQIFLTEPFGL